MLSKDARGCSDAALLAHCRDGDTSAFDEIVRRYKDRLYSTLFRILGDYEDARDVAQEVFVRAFRGLDGFRGEAQVYTWLYRMAMNRAHYRLRDRSRKGRNRAVSLYAIESDARSVAAAAVSENRTPAKEAESRELEEVLQQCLDELPEMLRMVFALRVFEELSYDEIADVMECPRGTVKSRLNQARVLLRSRLRELSVL